MKLTKSGAEIFIPDQSDEKEALARTTRMCIAAHQDDIEIMAFHGILNCFGKNDEWFLGVVATDGAGSPRNGLYENYTDEQMQAVRRKEQKKAAIVGDFGALALLDYPSIEAKNGADKALVNDLHHLLLLASPDIVYIHNIADKHDTHVGVALKAIEAIRLLPPDKRPGKLYGCEVWRALDWMSDNKKIRFDVSAHPNIAAALLGVFDSQIVGGKRYDLAIQGRRTANAVFGDTHETDKVSMETYAMDLTPLIEDESLDIAAFLQSYFDDFTNDVLNRLERLKKR